MTTTLTPQYATTPTQTPPSRLFQFYLPWDDSTSSEIDLSRYLDKPAGKYGYVYVGSDGHLYVGGKRIRFLGVNIAGGAAFPTKEQADRIAARLAKFGVNLVRFHHLEAPWLNFNIFSPPGTRNINKEALDRLDYFIYKLKESGIYIDLNLLVSRKFSSVDGLPREIDMMEWKDQHVLGYFYEPVLDLQKEYARKLLLHRNPYTGLTYAEDPAIAFIEIINENGLIHSWLDGVIDRMPQVFKNVLQEKWNAYLKQKYNSTDNLLNAWGGTGAVYGDEVLRNGDFSQGPPTGLELEGFQNIYGWILEMHSPAKARWSFSNETPAGVSGRSLVVRVLQTGEPWHIQFNYPGIRVREGETYYISFWAKADKETSITVCIRQAHEPWNALSQIVTINIGREWKKYDLYLTTSSADDNARLDISGLGSNLNVYYFTGFSMKIFNGFGLRDGESLEAGNIKIFTLDEYGARTLSARRDWIEFLWNLEYSYYMEMYRFLKEELKVKALIIGTIVGCGTPNILSMLDVVDAHAYWQHPQFPGASWDPVNWYVYNTPMVNNPIGSTIPWLALKRVYGKPFTVSEYNHPAPNLFDGETAIILLSYAALQDWDAIIFFSYGSDNRDWDSKRIRGFFDIDQHPTKMASLITAYMLFVRGDIAPSKNIVLGYLSKEDEIDLISKMKVSSWNLPDGRFAGLNPIQSLMNGVAMVTDHSPKPQEASIQTQKSDIVGVNNVYRSDTGEIIWDVSIPDRGVFIVNTSRSIVITGFIGNREFDFGLIKIRVGNTLLDGWGTVALHVVDGDSFENARKIIVIAYGVTANTNEKLYDYDTQRAIVTFTPGLETIPRFEGKITNYGRWGYPPTLVEGLDIEITVKMQEDINVWALNNIGFKTKALPVTPSDRYRTIHLIHEYGTIWYEILIVN
ncbi:Carbohydrate-binding CenC domain protein [Ignisphaera aggregans DSM 17230]|uniref:Carbohydrate-binding CenC domain protein n=1 Tax=Ignisphaera aggregans (strain DSM 17230 / JCM 13409 / AQ1.S1) TaxID=583356 RepID=E0SSZ7_IGNAA|nr:Carbohydrate-binding CenC domain protein [Ignisphaera aggregans DSM 17230]